MGGAPPAASLLFFGPRAKKDSADGSAPPYPPERELHANPLICAHSSHQFKGPRPISQTKRGVWERSPPSKTKYEFKGPRPISQTKRGVWGAKRPSPSGRRPAGGQGAKPPIENKASSRRALVSARSERSNQGVRFQSRLRANHRTRPQFSLGHPAPSTCARGGGPLTRIWMCSADEGG